MILWYYDINFEPNGKLQIAMRMDGMIVNAAWDTAPHT